MQTPAEKCLIEHVRNVLNDTASQRQGSGGGVRILNIGAGKSTVIEKSIQDGSHAQFVCDRVDVSDCTVQHPRVGECFVASVESMPCVPSARFDIAFANYVFEHVSDLACAAAEVHRVLKPNGMFVTSLPNPSAPEFILSKLTPRTLHQHVKGSGEGHYAHETHYAYKTISEFVTIFNQHGFATVEARYWSHTFGYLYRFPVLRHLSRCYDAVMNHMRAERFMGNVCIIFKKHV